jgi:hypothetical protein
MQTFLPYPDFQKSAQSLDWRRLNKQVIEAMQIANVSILLQSKLTTGWKNHPARRMWLGYEYQLCNYALACRDEWVKRGYNSNTRDKIINIQSHYKDTGLPSWIGREDFHLSHRQALLHKEIERNEPIWYKNQWPDLEPKLDYIWPV